MSEPSARVPDEVEVAICDLILNARGEHEYGDIDLTDNAEIALRLAIANALDLAATTAANEALRFLEKSREGRLGWTYAQIVEMAVKSAVGQA